MNNQPMQMIILKVELHQQIIAQKIIFAKVDVVRQNNAQQESSRWASIQAACQFIFSYCFVYQAMNIGLGLKSRLPTRMLGNDLEWSRQYAVCLLTQRNAEMSLALNASGNDEKSIYSINNLLKNVLIIITHFPNFYKYLTLCFFNTSQTVAI